MMTKYREILRLTALGLTQRDIVNSCDVSQKTVVRVQARARELNLSWPLDASMTDQVIGSLMYPDSMSSGSIKNPPRIERKVPRRAYRF